jgi:hypothetical protein
VADAHEHEQHVAQLLADLVHAAAGASLFQLVPLLAQLGHGSVEVGPVEAERRGLVLQAPRAGQRGQGRRHAGQRIERTFAGGRTLRGLELRPATLDLRGRARGVVRSTREHVRMPPDHLGDDRGDHVLEIEVTLTLADRTVEHDLEQQVTELGSVCLRVLHRVEHLVGFLEQVRPQRVQGLRPIPRAPVVGQEPLHERAQAREAFRKTVLGGLCLLLGPC